MYYPFLAAGAALGRMAGEAMTISFPDGLAFFPQDNGDARIAAAGYALVGAYAKH